MRTLMLTAALLIPTSAHAQSLAATTEELGYWLKPGERVVVTGRVACSDAPATPPERPCVDGLATRTVDGRFTLLQDGVEVVRGKARYVFPLEGIERVERAKDRIWNGALIGYVAGFAPFALAELDCRRSEGCWEWMGLAFGAIIAGPIGFGIGALTDALIHRPRLVYSRAVSQPAVSVRPILTRTGGGVRISLGF